jgi:hypothetical protein
VGNGFHRFAAGIGGFSLGFSATIAYVATVKIGNRGRIP